MKTMRCCICGCFLSFKKRHVREYLVHIVAQSNLMVAACWRHLSTGGHQSEDCSCNAKLMMQAIASCVPAKHLEQGSVETIAYRVSGKWGSKRQPGAVIEKVK